MPLTPLPASNTKRYKLTYTVEEDQHSLTARCSSAQTDGQALTNFGLMFADVAASLGSNVAWTQLEVALEGSDIFNVVSGWSALTGTGGAVSELDQPRSFCFAGRTNTGRKSKAFLWGIDSAYVTPDVYSMTPIVTATLADFRDHLNSMTDFWLGIDGVKPTWYDRYTVKVNDHWVDLRRV